MEDPTFKRRVLAGSGGSRAFFSRFFSQRWRTPRLLIRFLAEVVGGSHRIFGYSEVRIFGGSEIRRFGYSDNLGLWFIPTSPPPSAPGVRTKNRCPSRLVNTAPAFKRLVNFCFATPCGPTLRSSRGRDSNTKQNGRWPFGVSSGMIMFLID